MDTIFFISGMWSGKENFTNFRQYFSSKGYNCVSSILKYHNIEKDEQPDTLLATTSITDYVDKLEKEYNNITGPKIIMGHSMGGLLAQLLAARINPKKLILLSSAPPLGISALSFSVIKSFIETFLTPFFWKKPNKISFKSAKYAILNNLTAEKQLHEYNKFVYESGRAIMEVGLPMFDKKKSSNVDANNINCPILVLHGLLDKIVPYNTGVKIASKYQHVSTMKLFNNNAHLLQTEDGWEDVAEFINSWLQ